jgi:Family of unknown function (DUF5343)
MADNNGTNGESKVPYVTAYGSIGKALSKIQEAAVPTRFTLDFLSTKLGLTGSGARPVIPFFKRIGLIGPDGSPTDLYTRFRNPTESGAVAAGALRKGFASLFEVNEYAQDLSDKDLKGLIVQVTGIEEKSKTIGSIIGSFNAVKALANFDIVLPEAKPQTTDKALAEQYSQHQQDKRPTSLNLGYTINLHLPPTSDIAVFDAIFKSLSEHILKDK